MRLLVALVFACFGLAGAAGCSDDDFGQERPPSDLGAQQFDLAGADSGSTGGQDMAKVLPDGAPIVTCAQGFACNNGCNEDQACGQACLDTINTPNGQALFTALQKCFTLAAVGPCAAMCAMAGQECGVCLYMTCQAELTACTQDM